MVALVNDTDNHLRNVGFLREGAGWVLAPAFDINPNRNAGAARATAIAGSRYPSDTLAGLLELARSCGIAKSEAQLIIEEVLEVVARWRDFAEDNGAKGREIERFAEAFEVTSHAVRAGVTA